MTAVRNFSLHRLEIAGLSVAQLAHQFGTPCYVYDANAIVARIEQLQAFDAIRYAQKACSNLAIVDLVRRHGCVVDAVSAWEIRRALKAGYEVAGEPSPIVYTADIFDQESLDLVVEHGIHVNVGSPDMIDQLGERAPGSEITLRINPGFGHGHSQKTNTGGKQSKHGLWHGQLEDILRRADFHGLNITGVHMHIGSGTDLEHLAQVCGALEQTALQIGRSVRTISAGGGLPIPYQESESAIDLDAYYQLWDQTRQKLQQAWGHPVTLEIEAGRFLVAESGYLISEIRAIKWMDDNLFYLVDAGFNDLARPILYGAYHPMSIAPRSGQVSEKLQPVIVGGPLCESGDIFTQQEGGFVAHRDLPVANVGDLLVIECAGAYGSVMASNYNSKPLAAEVLLKDRQAHLIRSRQTFEEMIRGESIVD